MEYRHEVRLVQFALENLWLTLCTLKTDFEKKRTVLQSRSKYNPSKRPVKKALGALLPSALNLQVCLGLQINVC